jgi:hypothetical protein
MPRRSISRFKDPMAGAKAATFPGFVTPCDPTLREQAPAGADWLHEIKIELSGVKSGSTLHRHSRRLCLGALWRIAQ